MVDFNVRGFDDDGDDHSNDFNPTTDEGWFVPTDFGTLGATYPFYLKHYNEDESAEIGATGTGLFNPFLNMNGDSTLIGFNTNANVNNTINTANGTDISDPNTDAIQLGDIPIIYQDLDGDGTDEAYYVINLDINENVNSEVSLEELQIYTSSSSAVISDYHFDEGALLAFANNGGDPATDFTLRFDLDATGDNKLIMRDDGAGQGKLDYTFYFPVEMFAGSTPDTYLTLFSQFGPNPADDAGFAEWNVLSAARISGTKFEDLNGDGARDVDGADNIPGNSDDEAGLAGFTMYIDLNGNNKLDANEQTALTDANGNFEFGSLLPEATYIVREVLTAADVNGPGDLGTDVSFATYAPPTGLWDQTTGDATGDQVVNVTTGTTSILVGNMLLNPDFSVSKTATSITGGVGIDGLDGADSDGDVVNYTISIANTGNITLTGFLYTDDNADGGLITYVSGDDGDGDLEVDETWIYSATHTVTQAELDSPGTGYSGDLDDDGDTDNRVTVSFTEAGPKDADAATPLVYNPRINLEKLVSVNSTDGTDGMFVDADTALGPENVNVGADVWFQVVLENTGNVTLTDVDVEDINTTTGLPGATFDLMVDGLLTLDAINNYAATLDGDDGDGELDVGETWTITYNQAFDPGNHVNTAYVTTDEGASDNDAAHYYSLVNEGPGVRTPGFWSNLGFGFWDDKAGLPKQAGQACFADQELLYLVDSGDADNIADTTAGLLIGDYNKNGITDVGEDTLFISLADAQKLINASNKQLNGSSGDGTFMLGRDVVATWLNYLAGNNLDSPDDPNSTIPNDADSAKHFLNDAIDWMQVNAGTFGNGPPVVTNETFDVFKFGGVIKTNDSRWSGVNTDVADHTAAQMHGALDYYNNTGQTEPGGTIYAHDCDEMAFVQAITVYSSLHI